MEEIRETVKVAVKELFNVEVVPELSRPAEQFGDYSTNVALQLAPKLNQPPRQIAEQLLEHLKSQDMTIKNVEVAGAGFINFTLADKILAQVALKATELPKSHEQQEILVEFGDPNPFKEMHIGHLYSYIAGDAIAKLLDISGAVVKRLSYHGDVGRQVAQAIWGMRQMEVTDDASLGQAYSKGAQAYQGDEQVKADIDAINQHVYKQDDAAINELHKRGVELSFGYFDKILNKLSISNDRRYLESESTPLGLELVKANIGRVFKESQDAVIYEGEKVGLHTRVFITSKGLPTYETKDLGLVQLKDRDFPGASQSIVITANEQAEYFKVMLAALSEIKPELAQKTKHLSHGFLSLTTGKMSSRTGNVYSAAQLMSEVKDAAQKQYPEGNPAAKTDIAALKYSFLKHRLGSDIVFDVQESVSLEGNSGPYLQYAYARANSVLSKAKSDSHPREDGGPDRIPGQTGDDKPLEPAERSLVRKISEYPEVVAKAAEELMPHHICTYLYELAQVFNQFYEVNRVIGDARQDLRLVLVRAYANVLKHGLNTLGIEAPKRM